jgi:hypothetical protein
MAEQHRKRAAGQRSAFEVQKKSLECDEVIILGDFKENIRLPLMRDSVGRDYFSSAPVTVLTFVVYLRLDGTVCKRVFTILSRCVTHNAAFVILSVQTLLKEKIFDKVNRIIWWSDGGPHFRNKFLLAALTHPSVRFGKFFVAHINFYEPHHGKSEVDSIFGFYARQLAQNLPKVGIRTVLQLKTFLMRVTARAQSPHTFFEFVSAVVRRKT